MATYTTNINLKKPAQSDKIRIADFNGNADNIDAAFGADFGQSSKPSVNASINNLADGLAIVAQGNVHAAISAGQFVYVRGHGTLGEGLYVANQAISANGTLSSSNLDADTSGGLNALNSKIKQVYYNNSPFTWNTNLVDPTGTNAATIMRFGAVCVLNLQCKIRATPATESEDVLFYVPSTLAPETTARSAIVSNGSDTVVNYCGYGSWTEEGVTKYGAYIGSPVSKHHGKYCFASIVFVLANNV